MTSFLTDLALVTQQELVGLAQQGCNEAFAELMRRHEVEVYRFVQLMVKNNEDAWDYTQQTFFKAWKSIHSLEKPASFKPWLYRIARNTVYDYWRARKVYYLSLDEIRENMLPGSVCNPEEIFIGRELVHEALAALPVNLRECLFLQLVAGLSREEIAEAVGISASSVCTYVSAAKKQFMNVYQRLAYEHLDSLEVIDDA